MSLYDDIDEIPKPKSDLWNAGLTPSVNLMQAHVSNLRKFPKKILTATKPAISTQEGKKVSNEGELRFNHFTGKMEKFSTESSTIVTDDTVLKLNVKDEYNPLFPNDYEQISKVLETKRKIEEKREEDLRQQEAKKQKQDPSSATGLTALSTMPESGIVSESYYSAYEKPRFGGTSIAPPQVLMEDCTVVGPDDNSEGTAVTSQGSDTPGHSNVTTKYKTTSTAAKIMALMGFKEGRGLGKEEQGMAMALQVEKTSGKQGKIIHEKDIPASRKQSIFPPPSALASAEPSNVILLRNMVGPGEVDDDLQQETAEECSRYGQVLTCNIFELQDVPEEQAVRIFVEFVDQASASRAVNDLNGRYFGGRIVSAGFYNMDRFRNLEMSDEPYLFSDLTN